jgi:hypothetical protein
VYIQFTLTGHFKYWIGGQFLVPLDTSAAWDLTYDQEQCSRIMARYTMADV